MFERVESWRWEHPVRRQPLQALQSGIVRWGDSRRLGQYPGSAYRFSHVTQGCDWRLVDERRLTRAAQLRVQASRESSVLQLAWVLWTCCGLLVAHLIEARADQLHDAGQRRRPPREARQSNHDRGLSCRLSADPTGGGAVARDSVESAPMRSAAQVVQAHAKWLRSQLIMSTCGRAFAPSPRWLMIMSRARRWADLLKKHEAADENEER